MDKIFIEEQKNLSQIESKLDAIASKYENDAEKLDKEIADFYCVDYDDRAKLIGLRNDRKIAVEIAEQYRKYQDVPYFGRIDLDRDNGDTVENGSYFIGKEGIHNNSDVIVVDWRAPIGSCYYASNQKDFLINNEKYYLALKRAINIKSGKLINYKTEYDGLDVSLEGELIDPFLLTVLKDKRRSNRLTDIIRTIQGNQNEIIRKSITESFIVQGCAGSGKTMILLHRLSYLKFNNRALSFKGVKIITPNKYFDAHINELSKELGLNEIERFSVEEYYVNLIKRYSSKVIAISKVQSEKSLNTDLLKELYSIEYMEKAKFLYNEYWEKKLKDLDEVNLQQLFDKHSLPYPETNKYNSSVVELLEQGLQKIYNEILKTEEEFGHIKERIDNIKKEYGSVQEEYSHILPLLRRVQGQTERLLQNEMEDVKEKIEIAKNSFLEFVEHYDAINREKIEKENVLADYNIFVQLFDADMNSYIIYDQFVNQKDSLSDFAREELKELIHKIDVAEQEYKKIPFYNFGKKNNLKNEIIEKKNTFKNAIVLLLQDKKSSTQHAIKILQQELKTLASRISTLDENKAELKAKLEGLELYQQTLEKVLQVFKTKTFPNMSDQLTSTEYKRCERILSEYNESFKRHERLQQRITYYQQKKEELEKEFVIIKEKQYADEEKMFIENDIKNVKNLHWNELLKQTMLKSLYATYKKYEQKYTKINYRHKLYLKLLYCSFYFTRISAPDIFLNIDEAQDISVAEYKLLKTILGNQCVFNLYGDVNQSVYSYKGIMDWYDLEDLVGSNIYVLNENYRNTLEITNFCNQEFGAEVYPIGISGNSVLELSTEDAVNWLLTLKKKNPQYRVAIMHRHGLKAVQEKLQALLKGESVSWYEVDDNRISVISVETAKGLEFEAAVVIVDHMSNNEKYIAYTRALDQLTVVRDLFSPELMDEGENFTEDILEDAVISETNLKEIINDDSVNVLGDSERQKLETIFLMQLQVLLTKRAVGKDIKPSTNQDSHKNLYIRFVILLYNLLKKKQENELIISVAEQKDKTSEDVSKSDVVFFREVENILIKKLGSAQKFTELHKNILLVLRQKQNTSFSAPSGSMKSAIFYLLALKEHETTGKQTLLTAESHLQENELVLADMLGLKAGILDGTMDSFIADFKKDKYDVIFVSYDFLSKYENISPFIDYFTGKIAYWGLDNPNSKNELWNQIHNIGEVIGNTFFLMSKEGFDCLNLYDFIQYEITNQPNMICGEKVLVSNDEEKMLWLLENDELLYGQGIIYCDEEETCKKISKQLRKKRIKAEAYIDILNPENKERINYLTNSFSTGGLPILVTTHEIGKNLTNVNIRFIVHYDIPCHETIYNIHVGQLGTVDENVRVFDLG